MPQYVDLFSAAALLFIFTPSWETNRSTFRCGRICAKTPKLSETPCERPSAFPFRLSLAGKASS